MHSLGPLLAGSGCTITNSVNVSPPFDMEMLREPCGKVAFFELFAGSANLTRFALSRNFDAYAFDYARNKQKVKAPCALVDLSTEAGQSFVLELYAQFFVLITSLSPPCGTASRAREIPLKGKDFQPRPLRSSEHPLGLPTLEGIDKERVAKANILYKFSIALCFFLLSHCRVFFLENPTNSYFWEIPFVIPLLEHKLIFVADFQACVWGSKRPKWTRIISNHPAILQLCGTCPGDHVHLPWGYTIRDGKQAFATSEEAAFPDALCSQLADISVSIAVDLGFALGLKLDRDAPVLITDKGAAIASGIQPRRNPELSLVSEFKSIQELRVPPGLVAKVSESFPGAAASRVLRLFKKEGDDADDVFAIVGFFRSPEQFFNEALQCVHPADVYNGLPEELVVSVFEILTLGHTEIKRRRLLYLKHVLELAAKLKKDDAKILADMSPERRTVLAGKRFALLKTLLEEGGYTDVAIVDEMVAGIDHVGVPKKSGVFKDGGKLPAFSKDELVRSSPMVNASLINKMEQAKPDYDTDKSLWEATLQEVKNGWLQGPLTFDEVSALFPNGFCISRRFGIMQSGKLRSIDDLSESGINGAYGASEKLSLLGTDMVCSLVRTFIDSVKDGIVSIKLDSGRCFSGKLHSEWAGVNLSELLGKTLDLHKAYRQLTCKDSQRWASIVGLRCPETGRPFFFPAVSLLFGGSAAVMSFNRAARALWFLLVKQLNILACNFFDDYPIIEHVSLVSSTSRSLEVFFKLLGWKYSDDPDKDLPFSSEFSLLGIVLRLSDNPCVLNKQSRVEQINGMIDVILSNRKITTVEAACLRGRLQFASGQIYGKIAGRALQLIGEVVYCNKPSKSLSMELFCTLRWLKSILSCAVPRPVKLPDVITPIVVFTDAAIDDSSSMCAAVLCDPLCKLKLFFSVDIPSDLINNWKSEGAEVVIHHAEILPIYLVCSCWRNFLTNRRVLFFVDNQSSRFALIKGYSSVPKASAVIRAINEIIFQSFIVPWYAWVPTHSNIADAPSRNQDDLLIQSGYSKSVVSVPESFKDWETFTSQF